MFNFGKFSKRVCQCQEYMELLKRFFVSFLVKNGKNQKKKVLLLFFMKKSLFLSFVKMRNRSNFKQFTNYIT